MRNVFFAVLILILFSSCDNVVPKTLDGIWSIDIITYEDHDMRNCLLGNFIRFQEDDISFPITDKYCSEIIETYDKGGKWKIISSKDSVPVLNVITNNKIFSGIFEVKFKKDSVNKLLLMELRSNKSLIICRKGMYSYNLNINTINRLVELSSPR